MSILRALLPAVPALALATAAPLTIEIDPAGFNASQADIRAVCKSAAAPLLRHMPDLDPVTVKVTRGQHGPIALYRKTEDGAYQVRLDTRGTYWSQYAYQFAHEICHVLCGLQDDDKGNLWFEETLAELASLYCLREMSHTWRTKPPYGNWKSYAPSLRDYTDDIVRKRDDFLEISRTGLPAYYRKHATSLRNHPTDRDKNGAMALVLLALFERSPEHWNAIRWLGATPSPKGETFPQHLTNWRNAAPAPHKKFIETIADLYGVDLAPSP